MIVGVPRETKEGERRVALLPEAVAALVGDGHVVRVERGAGAGIGRDDSAYARAGATPANAAEAWSAELVVKVKELQERDFTHVPRGATVFSFHHLPGEPQRTRALAQLEATAIAFEMVRDAEGHFPLLAPMSAIAGKMAVDVGARLLGHDAKRVLILGSGHAGINAARAAARRRARVTLLTRSERSREAVREQGFEAEVATPESVARHAVEADLVVGAVFVAAQPTAKLLPRALVRRMKPGAVIVDVSIDAGGVAETSRPTTHAEPTFVEEGVIHYCVANMPAAVPAEGAAALSAAALPFLRQMARGGIARALRDNGALRAAVLLWKGRVNHADLAAEAGLPYAPLSDADLA